MTDINEIKSKTETIVMVGLIAGSTLTEALRNLINGLKSNGEKSIKDFAKDLQGKRFTSEGAFVLHAKNEKVGLSEVAVSNSELKEFQKLCKEYGVDFHFQKRPINLEELFHSKQAGKTLSAHQESIVNAFTVYDKNIPYLKPDGALITFKESDLGVMERVLDKMEEKSFGIEQRKIQAKKIVEQRKNKSVKTKKVTKEK